MNCCSLTFYSSSVGGAGVYPSSHWSGHRPPQDTHTHTQTQETGSIYCTTVLLHIPHAACPKNRASYELQQPVSLANCADWLPMTSPPRNDEH